MAILSMAFGKRKDDMIGNTLKKSVSEIYYEGSEMVNKTSDEEKSSIK